MLTRLAPYEMAFLEGRNTADRGVGHTEQLANVSLFHIQASNGRTAPRSSAEPPRPRVPRRARTKRARTDSGEKLVWRGEWTRPGADSAGSDNSGGIGGAYCYAHYHEHDDNRENTRDLGISGMKFLSPIMSLCFLDSIPQKDISIFIAVFPSRVVNRPVRWGRVAFHVLL